MNIIDNIKSKCLEIKRDFWSDIKLPYSDPALSDYFKLNKAEWIKRAKELRTDYPVETNLFLANIYRSNFSYKLIYDRISVIHKKPRYTVHEKIRILKNAYESSYHHFAFLTISSNYQHLKDSLYEHWYVPNKAREFDKNTNSGWKNDQGDQVSGKKWTLLNCSLFDNAPINIKLIEAIKNADSHEKLIIREKELIILEDGKAPFHISDKDFTTLFKFVFNCMNLAFQFNLILAVEHNFWVTPTLIICNPEKFDFRKALFPDEKPKAYRKKRSNKKGANKKENEAKISLSVEFIEYITALSWILFEFIYSKMWNRILEDEVNINNYLGSYNLKLDTQKFDEFHKNALADLLGIFYSLHEEIKAICFNEISNPSLEITGENIADFNIEEFSKQFQATISKIYSQDSKKIKNDFKSRFILSMIVSIFPPLGRIKESLNQIVTEC